MAAEITRGATSTDRRQRKKLEDSSGPVCKGKLEILPAGYEKDEERLLVSIDDCIVLLVAQANSHDQNV